RHTVTPERWRQVRGIFEQALATDPASRDAVVGSACAGDESLMREVRSLLEAHAEASEFLVSAPRSKFSPEPLIGRTVGRYQIESSLGMGGMGIVYRAYDPKLDRYVALKVLPPEAMNDAARERFVQEAKAASALNHPNIVTIYDAGTDGDVHFIAMELVQGKTLAALSTARELGPTPTLHYAGQIP